MSNVNFPLKVFPIASFVASSFNHMFSVYDFDELACSIPASNSLSPNPFNTALSIVFPPVKFTFTSDVSNVFVYDASLSSFNENYISVLLLFFTVKLYAVVASPSSSLIGYTESKVIVLLDELSISIT